jgi:DNA transformation protein
MDDGEIEEIFAGLGAVTIKRLFGGKGIYFEGLIVGIVRRGGELLLKADDETAPRFEAAGATRWTHVGRQGKTSSMPYWTIPADAFDDPERMAAWVRLAFAAAKRAADHR